MSKSLNAGDSLPLITDVSTLALVGVVAIGAVSMGYLNKNSEDEKI